MKYWQLLPFKIVKKAGQKGQAVVEFVMVLAVMAMITYFFVNFMNKNLTRYWEHAANTVVHDDPKVKTIKMPQ